MLSRSRGTGVSGSSTVCMCFDLYTVNKLYEDGNYLKMAQVRERLIDPL